MFIVADLVSLKANRVPNELTRLSACFAAYTIYWSVSKLLVCSITNWVKGFAFLSNFTMFDLWFYVTVKSYGHVETVSYSSQAWLID